MLESKIKLTHRLQSEGRWEEASRFKDEHIAKLRGEGMTRKEAQQQAWVAMASAFPALESDASDVDDSEDYAVDLIPAGDSATPEYHQDAEWAYQRLAIKDVKPEDAPSPGAWALLKWAKANKNRFFEQVMPKATAAKQRSDGVGNGAEVIDFGLEELDRMLEEVQRQWELEAVANTAQAVKDKVADRFSGWQRRFDLEIPSKACESWTLGMIELADDFIHAALNHPEEYRYRAG